MIDLTRVRTRWGRDPHYVNVDLDNSEIGYLVLNGSDEIVVPVTHDQHNEEDNKLMREICRLAQAFVGAAAACSTLGR